MIHDNPYIICPMRVECVTPDGVRHAYVWDPRAAFVMPADGTITSITPERPLGATPR